MRRAVALLLILAARTATQIPSCTHQLALPVTGVLLVYQNGLLLTAPGDYTLIAPPSTLPIPIPGVIVQSANSATGDTFAAVYLDAGNLARENWACR